MAVDRWTLEYHLTPKGWVVGTSTFFDKVEDPAVPRPSDAVETWIEKHYQKSAFSKEEVSFNRTWVAPDASPETISKLHAHFPDHDKDLAPAPGDAPPPQ
ncbi:MAG: hypothetical protein ACREOQ_17840 [Gemmatimonadales bacterium]